MMTREEGLEKLCYEMNRLVNQQEDLMNQKTKIWLYTTIIAFVGGLAIGWFFL